MNKKHENGDILKGYMNSGMIEKAPDAIGSKVMSMINLVPPESIQNEYGWRRKMIPAISASVTALLVIAAVLFTKEGSLVNIPDFSLSEFLKFSLPDLALKNLPVFNIPKVVTYLTLGFIFLSVFDRLLKTLFHRKQ